MHKQACFYASGFLYHPASQQILLQQPITAPKPSLWALFEGASIGQESPQTTFKRIIAKILGLKLNLKVIYPAYSYYCSEIHKDRQIIYAPLKTAKNFPAKKGVTFGWFTFKQITKLPLSTQAKHDVIVAQRVIAASVRKSLGQLNRE